MNAEWKLRDLEYSVIPELKRDIRDLRETIDLLKTRINQLEEELREKEGSE